MKIVIAGGSGFLGTALARPLLAYRQVLGVTQRPSWPPRFDAVISAGAQAATEAFVARGARRTTRSAD